jgi:sortase B
VDVQVSDPLLTLSTCSHEFDDARLVVVARLVRNGENPAVDTSRVTLNSNPRYPQVYYDKKKLNNPYANAQRWTIG